MKHFASDKEFTKTLVLRVSFEVTPRVFLLGLLALQLLGGSGCSLLRRPAPMTLPEGFSSRPVARELLDPQTRARAYAELFPALKNFQATGLFTAGGRGWLGKEHFQFHFFAQPQDGRTGPCNLRLRGFRSPTMASIFDIIVRGREMTVADHLQRLVFQGFIPQEGTPIERRWGVEPWDLVPILTIGRTIAEESFSEQAKGTAITLKPIDGAGKLERVELDKGSGLPRMAVWGDGDNTYEVRYLGWQYFTDSLTGKDSRLMPSGIRITRRRPNVEINLEADRYQFDRQVPESMFVLRLSAPYRLFPLENLTEAFGGQ
jgi:hypothetical protein